MKKAKTMNGYPELISLDMTSQCNLCCAHCYNSSGQSDRRDLLPEELLRTAGQIAALRPLNFCLCGGEPLLSDQLFSVLDIVRGYTGAVSMVSNGLLITRPLAEKLVRHGLSSVQISLDGAFAWQHDSLRGVEGSFQGAIRALQDFRAAGIQTLSVSLIPNKLNRQCLEDYVSLCASLHVDLIRSMPMMPMGRGKTVGRDLMLDRDEMFGFQRQLAGLKQRRAPQLRIEWDDPVRSARYLCRRILAGKPPLSICITSDGLVNTDVYAPVTLGSLREKSLQEILENGPDRARLDGRFHEVLQRLHNLDNL
ncbi:MAG: radical SAM protein [Candidatus Limivicinus sp.]|jgi:MoaA/NifB/PqqE/SkfB family radical SAM enzyme